MAYKCDFCGKKRAIQKQHRHKRGVAGGKWKQRAPVTPKIQLPNLHAYKMMVDGKKISLKLCTKCLRLAKKNSLPAGTPVKTEKK